MKLLIIFTIFSLSLAGEAVNYTVHQKALFVPEKVEDFVFQGDDSPPKRPKGISVKISNGRSASDTQFPFAALMSINLQSGGLLCTGSLIASNWIVSARHCIADTNAVSVLVSLGSADRESGSRTKIFSNLYVWLNGGGDPDIALFKLVRNAPNNNKIRPIRVPARWQENSNFDGHLTTVAGYGGIGGGRLSRYLQYANFRILSNNQCYLGDYLICSKPPTGSASLQGGDSGGPMIIYSGGVPTLVGINVVVVTAGSEVWQGSTRVSNFLSFIHEVTGIPYR